jgi:hypothetical protein
MDTKRCIECGLRWRLAHFDPTAPGEFASWCASCREREHVRLSLDTEYVRWLARTEHARL